MGLGHGVGGMTGGLVYSLAGGKRRTWMYHCSTTAPTGLQAVFVVATVVIACSWAVIGVVEAGRGRRRGWIAVATDDADDGAQ